MQVFTTVFVIEMIAKVLGYTPKGYIKNKWNLFDGFLVIVSLIDIILNESGAVTGGELSVLKVFRLVSFLLPTCLKNGLKNPYRAEKTATPMKNLSEVIKLTRRFYLV